MRGLPRCVRQEPEFSPSRVAPCRSAQPRLTGPTGKCTLQVPTQSIETLGWTQPLKFKKVVTLMCQADGGRYRSLVAGPSTLFRSLLRPVRKQRRTGIGEMMDRGANAALHLALGFT